jgi:hypothetical protein
MRLIPKSRLARYALLLSAFIALGYFSNVVTLPSAEASTTAWLNDTMSRHPSNWPGRRASSNLANFVWPWIVSVEYGWVVGPVGGEWGRRYYLCLFGIAVPIRNRVTMMA